MKTAALIEARSTSTRLPGKIFETVGHGQSMLEMIMRRLSKAQTLDDRIIVCPDGDYVTFNYAMDHGWPVVQGTRQDHGNVMRELLVAAALYEVDLIVEITGDCPFIDPEKVDETVGEIVGGNCHFAGFLGPSGFEVRAFWRQALEMALEEIHGYERNGSTIFYDRKEWDVRTVPCACTMPGRELKYSVDTEADLAWVRKLYREVSWDARFGEILAAGVRLSSTSGTPSGSTS